MSPRKYDMKSRSASVERTRRRILDAALAVYPRTGFAGATMVAIAREADVSPATVLNHFATPQELREAALDVLLGRLRLPEPSVLDGARGLDGRLRILVREMAAFYDRSEAWNALYDRPDERAHLRKAEAAFYARLRDLIVAALGRDLADRRTVDVVVALVQPHVLRALPSPEFLAELLGPWLERRRRKKR